MSDHSQNSGAKRNPNKMEAASFAKEVIAKTMPRNVTRQELERWARDPEFSKYVGRPCTRRAIPVTPEQETPQQKARMRVLRSLVAAQQFADSVGLNWRSVRLGTLSLAAAVALFFFGSELNKHQRVQTVAQDELAQMSKYVTAAQLSSEEPATLIAEISPAWKKLPYEYQKIETDKIRFWLTRNRIALSFLKIRHSIVGQVTPDTAFLPVPKAEPRKPAIDQRGARGKNQHRSGES